MKIEAKPFGRSDLDEGTAHYLVHRSSLCAPKFVVLAPDRVLIEPSLKAGNTE
jgi:hypothetical protein